MEVDFETYKPIFEKQLSEFNPLNVRPSRNFVIDPEVLTVVGFLNDEVTDSFKELYNELGRLNKNDSLFLVPLNKLHLTIIGGFSCRTDVSQLKTSLSKSIQKPVLSFNIASISSNDVSVSPFALPIGFSLKDARNRIRKELGENGTDYTKYVKEYENISWVNILRYTEIPTPEVKGIFQKYLGKTWGRVDLKELNICRINNKIVGKDDIIETLTLT
jgi:hypothetical protein